MKTNAPEQKRPESASEIENSAASWAAKADRGDLSFDEQIALEKWLGADTRRLGAYARALAVNAHFDRAAALGPGFSPDDFEEARPSPPPALKRRHFLFAGGAALAASVAAAVGFGALSAGAAVVAAKGDTRRIALAEGSAITLNTDSRIEPRFEERLRQVDLVKGEALFDVSRDRNRPFVVHAGDVRVRVLGTSFSVRRFNDGAVEVAVLEGHVEVGAAGELHPHSLRRGQRVRVSPRGDFRIERVSHAALERSVGWRRGIIDLQGMTLAQAAAEYARYSDRRIVIADPAVGAMKVTGVYSTSDPLGFARAAALSLGIQAIPTADGVRLNRR